MRNRQSKRSRPESRKNANKPFSVAKPTNRKKAAKKQPKTAAGSRLSGRPAAKKTRQTSTQPARKGVPKTAVKTPGAPKPGRGTVVNIQAAQIEKLTNRLNALESEVRALRRDREPHVYSEPAPTGSNSVLPRHFDERLSEIVTSLKPGGGMLASPDRFESDVTSLTSRMEDLLRTHQELLDDISEQSIQKLHRNRIGQLESAIAALADTDLVDEEEESVEVFLSRLREVLLEDLAGPPAA